MANTRSKGTATDRTDDHVHNASDTPASGFYPASDFPATPEPSANKKEKGKAKTVPKKPKKKPTKRGAPEKISGNQLPVNDAPAARKRRKIEKSLVPRVFCCQRYIRGIF
jgi:hypothetical protein